MRLAAYLRALAGKFFHRSEFAEDMNEELRSHIQLRADDLERSGLSRPEAERRSRIEFGAQERVKEECNEAVGGNFIESLVQDVRFSVRVLRKSPGFTVIAVMTLALAIGANAVVFAALNALILRPLDLPRTESLYSIHRVDDNSAAQSYPDYLDLRGRTHSFEDLAGFNILTAGLDAGGNPSRAWLFVVTGNYFDVLGIQPRLGRFFHGSDEHGPNSAPYIVLSRAYWHSRFQDDPAVIGRVVQVNKHPFTILGVAPDGFHGSIMFFSPDFFLPLVNQEQIEGTSVLNARGNRWIFMTIGHLKPGVTTGQAAADFNSVYAGLERTYPRDHRPATYALARPGLYGNYLGRPVRAFLSALMVLAGLILLAACANLGSLFAARAADHSQEVALRLALGASRRRVMRQLFTEAVLISLVGGAIGLWGSIVLMGWLRTWQPFPQFPINIPVSPDANVYGVAFLLAVASGFVFGAIPVKQVMRTDPYEVVKSGSRATNGRRLTGLDLLVVVQIAICAVLVTSSLVAVRGLLRSMRSNLGFEPRNSMLVNTDLNMAGYSADAVPAMQKRMIDAIGTIPEVQAVGLVDQPPLANSDARSTLVFRETTTDFRPANSLATAMTMSISPGYLSSANTPLLSGRNITWHDEKNSPRVAVINQEFAHRIFGSVSEAVGRYYKLRDGTQVEVVGIVPDGKYANLNEDPQLAMFVPILQSPSSDSWLVVRSNGDPQQLSAAIKSKLLDLDAGLPSTIQTWADSMDLVLFPARVATAALGVLGLMGAMLSVTGIFGMAAYSVSKRLRELGIRMALGAQRREVLQAALGRAFKLLAFGSVAGLLMGILAARVLAFIVYQATPRDPVVLGGVVLAMLLLGLVATWIPAQRALSVDPLILLREQ